MCEPLIATGASPLEVSRRAGHTSASFTLDRYGHLYPEANDAVAERHGALVVSAVAARPAAAIGTLARISDGQGTDGESDADAEVLPFTAPDMDEQQWALRDSNPRPQPCEGCALTS
jgi:hypothetical protein